MAISGSWMWIYSNFLKSFSHGLVSEKRTHGFIGISWDIWYSRNILCSIHVERFSTWDTEQSYEGRAWAPKVYPSLLTLQNCVTHIQMAFKRYFLYFLSEKPFHLLLSANSETYQSLPDIHIQSPENLPWIPQQNSISFCFQDLPAFPKITPSVFFLRYASVKTTSKGSHWIPSCRWSIKNRGQVDLIKDIPHQVGETNTWIHKSLGRGLWSWTSELCMGSPVNSRKHMGNSLSNSLDSKGGKKPTKSFLGLISSWHFGILEPLPPIGMFCYCEIKQFSPTPMTNSRSLVGMEGSRKNTYEMYKV